MHYGDGSHKFALEMRRLLIRFVEKVGHDLKPHHLHGLDCSGLLRILNCFTDKARSPYWGNEVVIEVAALALNIRVVVIKTEYNDISDGGIGSGYNHEVFNADCDGTTCFIVFDSRIPHYYPTERSCHNSDQLHLRFDNNEEDISFRDDDGTVLRVEVSGVNMPCSAVSRMFISWANNLDCTAGN
jgi:hypothetical protein